MQRVESSLHLQGLMLTPRWRQRPLQLTEMSSGGCSGLLPSKDSAISSLSHRALGKEVDVILVDLKPG